MKYLAGAAATLAILTLCNLLDSAVVTRNAARMLDEYRNETWYPTS